MLTSEAMTRFGTLNEDGSLSNIREYRQSDLRKCRFTILAAEHYRANGSCKCDDPAHREMMIKEWGYSRKDFKGIPLRRAATTLTAGSGIPRHKRIGAKGTTLSRDEKGYHILTVYETIILKYNEREIILNSGGYRTKFTKDRMNQTSNQLNLGFNVYQKDLEWYVNHNEKTIPFKDGMKLKIGRA